MDEKQTLAEKLKEAVGLPGRRPDGTLTADDAQGLPPHSDVGPGLKREEE